jgi:hypothetical protein
MCNEGQYKSRVDKANQPSYSAQTLSFYALDTPPTPQKKKTTTKNKKNTNYKKIPQSKDT